MYKQNAAIIIPSLEPDDKLLYLLDKLNLENFKCIILINDGSSKGYDKYFEIAKSKYNCHLIKHSVNLGKGRALKNAFNYILTERPNITKAITVDSDGQHSIEDIKKCLVALENNEDSLIMGCRNFYDKDKKIPFRSKFGNVLTHKVLNMLCGINVVDTQTGLRGFSRKLMKKFMTTKGERFEFEMNMLIDAKENSIAIKEVPIKTIYIEENKTSHFNPLKDSIKIYTVFSKFIFSSVFSFLVDIVLFTMLVHCLNGIIPPYITVSAYIARVVSAFVNYLINKNKVFKDDSHNVHALTKYAILCVIQITISAFATKWIFELIKINVTLIKAVVDIILFFISFRIQRSWVFKK